MFKENQLYKYEPVPRWARHGLAVVVAGSDGKLYFIDTYYDRYWDAAIPLEGNESRFTFVADLDEFETANARQFDVRLDADRVWIPMGSSSEKFYIRKGSTPDRMRVLAQIHMDIDNARSEISSGERALRHAMNDLTNWIYPSEVTNGDVARVG